VATNDCHYLTHDDAHAQEVLMCIQTGKTMSDAQRMKFATDQFYFKTAEEMARCFAKFRMRFPHGGHRRAAAT
jgi:DNA polymerase III subunit alpha